MKLVSERWLKIKLTYGQQTVLSAIINVSTFSAIIMLARFFVFCNDRWHDGRIAPEAMTLEPGPSGSTHRAVSIPYGRCRQGLVNGLARAEYRYRGRV